MINFRGHFGNDEDEPRPEGRKAPFDPAAGG